ICVPLLPRPPQSLSPFHICRLPPALTFFSSHETATTDIYTLSLHDALPIFLLLHGRDPADRLRDDRDVHVPCRPPARDMYVAIRSEEHTSELQSHLNLVCRLLLEKKNNSRVDTRAHRRAEVTMHR